MFVDILWGSSSSPTGLVSTDWGASLSHASAWISGFRGFGDQGEVVRPLGRANERDQRGGLGGELLPFRRHGVEGARVSPICRMARRANVARCAAAHPLAFGLRLGGEADKLLIAIGEGGEVEA